MAPSRVRIPPSPLAQRPPRLCAHPRRGGRAVECGGLENRYPSLGGSRVQIPPPPLFMPNPMRAIVFSESHHPCGPLRPSGVEPPPGRSASEGDAEEAAPPREPNPAPADDLAISHRQGSNG